jgi:hypothetical protein
MEGLSTAESTLRAALAASTPGTLLAVSQVHVSSAERCTSTSDARQLSTRGQGASNQRLWRRDLWEAALAGDYRTGLLRTPLYRALPSVAWSVCVCVCVCVRARVWISTEGTALFQPTHARLRCASPAAPTNSSASMILACILLLPRSCSTAVDVPLLENKQQLG